jgi:hypothetical protein
MFVSSVFLLVTVGTTQAFAGCKQTTTRMATLFSAQTVQMAPSQSQPQVLRVLPKPLPAIQQERILSIGATALRMAGGDRDNNREQEDENVNVSIIPDVDAGTLTALGFGAIAFNFLVLGNLGTCVRTIQHYLHRKQTVRPLYIICYKGGVHVAVCFLTPYRTYP